MTHLHLRILPALLVICTLLVAAPSAVRAQAAADPPTIHVYIFGSTGCDSCKRIQAKCVELGQELGCRIVRHRYDVDDISEYKRLIAMEKRFDRRAPSLPVVFVGNHMLTAEEADEKLDPLLRELATAGGSPELEIPGADSAPTGVKGVVRLAYFRQPGCKKCSRVEHILDLAKTFSPGLEIKSFAVADRKARLLMEALCERAAVAADSRLTVPAVFVGDEALVGDAITDQALQDILSRHAGTGQAAPWEVPEPELVAARERLVARFRTVGIASVIVGGLVDSINPCAFATLVFLISYLATMRRTGRDVFIVGGAFTLGVFAAYFVMGLGLSEVLLSLEALPRVAGVVTWGIIGLTFVLAAVSLRDFVLAVRGRTGDMALKLPKPLRMRINRVISKHLHTRTLAVSALTMGLVVSLLELACTGQVYFPLIRFMNSVSVDRARTLTLLCIYNLAFVAPLVLIFAAAGLGLKSDRLMTMLKKEVAPVKLIMALFFAALGTLMIYFR